ncbi:MAG TPA: flavodoxin family protein [Ruminococcus sp.]
MPKKVLIISTSMRANSNSEKLAAAFANGAKSVGNDVEIISLRNKKIEFCKGCLVCHKIGKCIIDDDANEINEKLCNAEIVVWATPIYFYEMSGSMKTMIDRANALYNKDCMIRDVYLLSTAAQNNENEDKGALNGVKCWIECLKKPRFAGKILAGGVRMPNEIDNHTALKEAYKMGKNV